MGVARGEDWGAPAERSPDLELRGEDGDLARMLEDAGVVGANPRPFIRFLPSPKSDLASAIGLSTYSEPGAAGIALPLDVLVFGLSSAGPVDRLEKQDIAVNGIEVGAAADRVGWWNRSFAARISVDGATIFNANAVCIVVMTGEYLRGKDVSPRGHPGDGKAEVYVYTLRRAQRRSMRRRLTDGSHLPHPEILRRVGSSFEIALERPAPVRIDSLSRGNAIHLRIDVLQQAYALLV